MGSQEVDFGTFETRELPDTYGLQEHFITDVEPEVDGPNVRIVCGVRKGGQMHWLYSSVMRWDHLTIVLQKLTDAAAEARGRMELMAGRGH